MKKTWKSFLTLCLKSKTDEELNDLLDLFLTLEEKESISDRYAIIHGLLANKETQRELSQSLNVSIAKITRGSNALKTAKPLLKLTIAKKMGIA